MPIHDQWKSIFHDEDAFLRREQKRIIAMQSASGLLGMGGNGPAMHGAAGGPGVNTARRSYTAMEKLLTRLDLRDGHPWDFLHAQVCGAKDHVVVFVIKDGEPLTFTDEIPLFPTDALIGKLNLLRG